MLYSYSHSRFPWSVKELETLAEAFSSVELISFPSDEHGIAIIVVVYLLGECPAFQQN